MIEQLLKSPAGNQWKQIGLKHHYGINVPLFSIISQQSCGIGEYSDFIPLIDWCSDLGMDVIQTLPLNDNGRNSSPYSSLSAFALNPLHLGLSQLPHLSEHQDLIQGLQTIRTLNATQQVDYVRLHAMRDQWLRRYHERVKGEILTSEAFLKFRDNNPWLTGYSLFKSLKIYGMWQDWEMWNDTMQCPSERDFDEMQREFRGEIDFHDVVQFLCFEEMERVKKHADSKGVFLKGDIPILINRESADVWQHRELFDLKYSAGAPPDMYTPHGQNWGFPTYQWDVMKQHGYHWWKLRLEIASRLYHIYRIDHIVGFFRIWVIPPNLTGREGWFIPEDTSLWISQGEEILKMMLESSPMLPIGEDLGIVPDELHVCLKQLGIAGTKVPRWERNWEYNGSFIPFENYPKLSMTTISTHDSETVEQWWNNNSEDAQMYCKGKNWQHTHVLTQEYRREMLRDSNQSGSLFHINLLQEYLALVPEMAWANPDDERINIPGLVSNRNWAYRFKPSIEEIISSAPLADAILSTLK